MMVGAAEVVTWMKSGAPSVIKALEAPSPDLFSVNQTKKFFFEIKHSALYELARTAKRAILPRKHVKHGVGKNLTSLRQKRQQDKKILDETGDPHEMLNNYEKWLLRCIAQLKEKNIRIILLTQPWFDRDTNLTERSENLGGLPPCWIV